MSSLFEFDRVADRIKQARQVVSNPVIVVEGKADRRFISRLEELVDCEIFIAYTRSRVLDAADDIKRLSLENVVCVVDRDFDDVVGEAEERHLALVPYDNSDLEAMLWLNDSLEDLVEELGSEDKLAAFGGLPALRTRVVEVLEPLSRLRRANAVLSWGINFDGLNLSSKVESRSLSLNVQSLCDALWQPDLGLRKSQLYDAAANFPVTDCPYTQSPLVRGKDALVITGVALRRLIGSLTHQQAAYDRLAEILRLAAPERSANSSTWIRRLRQEFG